MSKKRRFADNKIKLLRELSNRLDNYNAWRRGDDRHPMPDPETIGKDIDAAVQAIHEYVEALQDLEADRK